MNEWRSFLYYWSIKTTNNVPPFVIFVKQNLHSGKPILFSFKGVMELIRSKLIHYNRDIMIRTTARLEKNKHKCSEKLNNTDMPASHSTAVNHSVLYQNANDSSGTRCEYHGTTDHPVCLCEYLMCDGALTARLSARLDEIHIHRSRP